MPKEAGSRVVVDEVGQGLDVQPSLRPLVSFRGCVARCGALGSMNSVWPNALSVEVRKADWACV